MSKNLNDRIAAHFAELEAGTLATPETLELAKKAVQSKIDFHTESCCIWARNLVASVGNEHPWVPYNLS